MAKTNWAALQIEYIKSYAKTGVSVPEWCKKKGINYSTAKRYIKKPETAFAQMQNCETNCETANAEKTENSNSYEENCETNCEIQQKTAKANAENCEIAKENSQISEKTAKEIAKRASQSAKMTKHGGYARYFKDKSAFDVVKDFSLGDEIDLMRQRAVTAIESIEKFTALLEKSEGAEDKEMYAKLIKSAENSLDRAVARIESLNYTDNSIANMLSQIEHRKAMTKKTLIEADKLAQELNVKVHGTQTIQFLDEF